MPEVSFDSVSCALCLTCRLWWPRCTNLKVLHYYIFFCLYMYNFVFYTLTASGTISSAVLFVKGVFSLFSWFNKLVASKAKWMYVVCPSPAHIMQPSVTPEQKLTKRCWNFIFEYLQGWSGQWLFIFFYDLFWYDFRASCSVSFSIHLVNTSCRKRACNLYVMSQVQIS